MLPLAHATQVRSMYLLLPQLVARDQEGAGEAVAAHFASAAAWDRVLHARVRGGRVAGRQRVEMPSDPLRLGCGT